MKNNLNKTGVLVDIGGTTVKFGSISSNRDKPLCVFSTPSDSESLLKLIIDNVNSIFEETNIDRKVIISCPGLVTRNGVVKKALYVPLSGVDIKREISLCTKSDVFVENDANVQALGMYEECDLLYMCIGTAIGGAYISSGQVLAGNDGFSCEFGHVGGFGDEKCFCGMLGCLDTVASGRALELAFGEIWWTANTEKVNDILTQVGGDVGKALSRLNVLFNPGQLVLAGRLCQYTSFTTSVYLAFNNSSWDRGSLSFIDDTWYSSIKGGERVLYSMT